MSRRLILIVAAVVVILVGFILLRVLTNEDGEPTATETTTTISDATTTMVDDGFPVTIEAPNGLVTIEARPERIVSISPTATEVLFAVGAGDQVVAVDDQSNYPQEVPVTNLSGFTPNIEAIVAYDPDLVILSFDPGDIVDGLEAVGIPVILHPAAVTVEDAYTQWEQVGAATGNLAEAVALVASTSTSIDESLAALPDGVEELSFYHELDPTFYSATSSTFIGSLYARTGMMNIADASDPDGYGFPQLTSEYIVDADPAIIFLADTKCCGQDDVSVSERPGWNTMRAVTEGTIVELDDDVASRWGPRIADFMHSVVVSVLELERSDA